MVADRDLSEDLLEEGHKELPQLTDRSTKTLSIASCLGPAIGLPNIHPHLLSTDCMLGSCSRI